jgi:hypothetical protein
MAIKTFTTGEVLTAADTNTYLANSGLVFINSTTVGSAVATVSTPAGTFSATYDAYRIVFTNITPSVGAQDLSMQMNNAGTPATGANYARGGVFFRYSDLTLNGFGQNNATSHIISSINNTAQRHVGATDIFSPFDAQYTGFWAGAYLNRTDITVPAVAGCHAVATSYDRLTILPSTGTITGGTITVYGYRKQ